MKFITLSILLYLIITPSSFAGINDVIADSEAIKLSTSILATPLKRSPPKYPEDAARSGKEGWVTLSYAVTETGDVENIEVIDNSGDKLFKRSARRALKTGNLVPQNKMIKKFIPALSRLKLLLK